ncbi:Trypsin epsilon, partial [Gryllus bimaculatus]
NDVSILLLNEPLVFTDYVKHIKLAAPGVNHDGTTVLSGWGVTDSIFRTPPDVLLTEELPVVNHSVCVDRVGRRFFGVSEDDLPDSILCTGPLAGGMGPCPGDSGGPLTQNGVLVGVVSWGPYICGTANVPSGFTRVSAFTQWITTATANFGIGRDPGLHPRTAPAARFPAPPRPAPAASHTPALRSHG